MSTFYYLRKNKLDFVFLLFALPFVANCQIGVNSTGALPHASAILDANSTTKGFLTPRMTLSQRNAISTPATGLIIYQTDGATGLYYFNGTIWTTLTGATGFLSTGAVAGNTPYWNGSTWVLNSSNIFNNGANVGIGTINPPLTKLEVAGNVLSQNSTTVSADPGAISPPVSGTGTRLLWLTAKSAFRAGTVNDTQWDAANIGTWSFASGYNSTAKGNYSTAMGNSTTATGNNSTAMGAFTVASGASSTAMGGGTTTASGAVSTAMGGGSIASGDYSTAIGNGANASGNTSTAIGFSAVATGVNSMAMGESTVASGSASTTTGSFTKAIGTYSTAFGQGTMASGTSSTAMGYTTVASGNYSTAIGHFTTAQAYGSLALGRYNTIAGNASSWVYTDPIFVIGNGATDISTSNSFLITKAGAILATGDVTNAVTPTSGAGTRMMWIPKKAAFRAGIVNDVQWDDASVGINSFATGGNTVASGNSSTAHGFASIASGDFSTAMGGATTASSSGAVSMGFNTFATGENSTAMGISTFAQAYASLVIGRFNIVSGNSSLWGVTDPVFVIGNGTFITPSNAFTVLKNGNTGIGGVPCTEKLEVFGNIKASGTILGSQVLCPSDIRFKKNIKKLENSLVNILKLKGVRYDWRQNEFPEKNFSNKNQIGFIAQDIEETYPEVVFTDAQGYKSIDYSRLTPMLVECIKEQQKQIEGLKNRVSEIDKIKSDMANLKSFFLKNDMEKSIGKE